jgi:hypothetical protein
MPRFEPVAELGIESEELWWKLRDAVISIGNMHDALDAEERARERQSVGKVPILNIRNAGHGSRT